MVKIISGGQTGADRAALDAAIHHELPHGGWCPAERRAVDGSIDMKYDLQETPSSGYLQRNKWNVRDSDATVIFTMSSDIEGGSRRTVDFAQRLKKPSLHIHPRMADDPASSLFAFIVSNDVEILNVAGSSASREPEVYDFVVDVLSAVFLKLGGC